MKRRREPLDVKRACHLLSAVSALGLTALAAGATELTFDVFLDAARKTRDVNRAMVDYETIYRMRGFYGSRVTEFSPEEVHGGHFRVGYGRAGGPTPGIEVEFRRMSRTDPTNTDPAVNGDPNGAIWPNPWGESGMTNVLQNPAAKETFVEIRFVPDAKCAVVIRSFRYGSYGANATENDTLKVVANPNATSPQVLWRAASDGSVVVTCPATRYAPGVTGEVGRAVSLIFLGPTGNEAIDDIVFSEVDAKQVRR